MHKRRFFVNICFAIPLTAATIVSAQEDYEIPDLNPSKIQLERPSDDASSIITPTPTDESKKNLSPSRRQPSSGPEILQNELRQMSEDSNANHPEPEENGDEIPFGAQPFPPQSRGSFNLSDGAGNPMQELDPRRLMPNLSTQPPATDPKKSDSPPSLDPSVAAGVPGVAKQSILTPRIPNSVTADSRIVAAVYEDQDQQPGRFEQDNILRLLQRYEVSSAQQPLPGVPSALGEMLRATAAQSRLSMLQQYWETYFDWATLQNRKSWSGWLGQLPQPRSRPQQMILQTAKSMAANDVLAAEIQLARSQSKLQQLAGLKNEQLLPLPLNQPLTGNYITHYEWYASRQLLPARLKGINEMLPRTHKLIARRADTVQQAVQARNEARNAFSSGQIGIGDLLESGRNWQSSLQSFVSTVISYNQAISDYAITITTPQKPVDQILTMLVAKPKSAAAVATRNSILQRTTQPLGSNRINSNSSASQNFNRGARNGAPGVQQGRSAENSIQNAVKNTNQFSLPTRNFQQPAGGNRVQNPTQPTDNFRPPARQPTRNPGGSQFPAHNRSQFQSGNSNQFNGGGGGSFGG